MGHVTHFLILWTTNISLKQLKLPVVIKFCIHSEYVNQVLVLNFCICCELNVFMNYHY